MATTKVSCSLYQLSVSPRLLLGDVRRHHRIPVLAALLKQPLYLSMLGCGFSSREINRAKYHVLEKFVASHPTLG